MWRLYVLTVSLAILKLAEYISWSWVWVVSPIWIEAMLLLGFVIVCASIVAKKVKNEGVEVVEMPLLETGNEQIDVNSQNQDDFKAED